jgi:hypothetical protein
VPNPAPQWPRTAGASCCPQHGVSGEPFAQGRSRVVECKQVRLAASSLSTSAESSTEPVGGTKHEVVIGSVAVWISPREYVGVHFALSERRRQLSGG